DAPRKVTTSLGGKLLSDAVDAPAATGDLGYVHLDDRPARKGGGDCLARLFVFGDTELGHDDAAVSDIEIDVGGRIAPAFRGRSAKIRRLAQIKKLDRTSLGILLAFEGRAISIGDAA